MKPSQNLLSWQVFVATCRTRSISQAAVLLDIDLPKASRLLSALETELGEPLFDKSHRPIQPTPRAAELQRAVEPSSRRSFRSDHSQLQQFDHGSISYAGISETARDAALAGGSQNARRASA